MNLFEMVIGIVLIVTIGSIIRAKMGVGRDKTGNDSACAIRRSAKKTANSATKSPASRTASPSSSV